MWHSKSNKAQVLIYLFIFMNKRLSIDKIVKAITTKTIPKLHIGEDRNWDNPITTKVNITQGNRNKPHTPKTLGR